MVRGDQRRLPGDRLVEPGLTSQDLSIQSEDWLRLALQTTVGIIRSIFGLLRVCSWGKILAKSLQPRET